MNYTILYKFYEKPLNSILPNFLFALDVGKMSSTKLGELKINMFGPRCFNFLLLLFLRFSIRITT